LFGVETQWDSKQYYDEQLPSGLCGFYLLTEASNAATGSVRRVCDFEECGVFGFRPSTHRPLFQLELFSPRGSDLGILLGGCDRENVLLVVGVHQYQMPERTIGQWAGGGHS